MKKYIYILIPLILVILLVVFLTTRENDNDEQTQQGNIETNEVQTDTEYGIHVPQSEFAIGLRDILDEGLQEHIGYSEVLATDAENNNTWGYRLNSAMTKDDWIALDTVLDHPSLIYATPGNDESITFEMSLVDYSSSIEDVNGFTGVIDIEGTSYYWTGEERNEIFYIGLMW